MNLASQKTSPLRAIRYKVEEDPFISDRKPLTVGEMII